MTASLEANKREILIQKKASQGKGRQKIRQKDRQMTDRQTDKQTNKQTDRRHTEANLFCCRSVDTDMTSQSGLNTEVSFALFCLALSCLHIYEREE
jgi:hypothetical protein